MTHLNIGFLHPGAMGISLAASAQNSGCVAYWVSEGRSQQTQERALKYKLVDAETLEALCQDCSILISICPPHAAEDVAAQVVACAFQGVYVDANAIAPQRALQINQHLSAAGISFVDGSVVGGPAWEPGKTWLHLAGPEAEQVAACFSAGPLETNIMGEVLGKASALKMCYAAYSKGSTALLCAILATAEGLDVRAELEAQWSLYDPDFATQAHNSARRVTAKAWRFAGEMDEIAATFEAANLPGDFHLAAGDIYRRMAHFKDDVDLPTLEIVLDALRKVGM